MFKFYRLIIIGLSMPIILAEYFNRQTGKEYHVGLLTKCILFWKMMRNYTKINSASNVLEHLIMATQILNIPKSIEGCVVECGSYKGGSTANLSLVCRLCNRHLEIFDSFKGLPVPSSKDKTHIVVDIKQVHTYFKGAYQGTLKEVKRNISKYGEINSCSFNKGYFDNTLPSFKKPCVFVFCDVDLRNSLMTCLKYLWPLLNDGCYFFTHEAPHAEIASLFYDREWWHNNIGADPPGLVGAGSGLGLLPANGGFKSSLGYTVKNPKVLAFEELPQR